MSDSVLFWFRRDLRLADNPALIQAAKRGKVIPVYVLDQDQEAKIGGASQWWLHHSLASLAQSLGGKLTFFVGNASQIIPQLAKETKAKAVFWNKCYEPNALTIDEALETQLTQQGVESNSFDGTLLWPPGSITKKDGTPFKVYKAFLRNRLAAHAPQPPQPEPRPLNLAAHQGPNSVALADLHLLPKIPWDAGINATWTPGEAQAKAMLESFVTQKLVHYGNERNFPAHDVLSRLSPYIHYGELSPNQIWYAVQAVKEQASEQTEKFISEVVWRDFSYHLLTHFPQTVSSSYNERLKKLKWHYDADLLKKWQQGQTGIPIVDAGMRQLWQTGYMHNRARMITASFLTKNLLIDWRTGADWFLDCLVDADVAVNTLNWQWVAGTGLDAAPFFRIFNPVLQSKKYDTDGTYIKTFVPELKDVPARYVHQPWSAPAKILQQAKVELGKDYPKPCVDLGASAQDALRAYHETAR